MIELYRKHGVRWEEKKTCDYDVLVVGGGSLLFLRLVMATGKNVGAINDGS